MSEGQGLADRATFLVDPNGVIQTMEVTAEGIGRDAEDLLRKVKAAQYGRNHRYRYSFFRYSQRPRI